MNENQYQEFTISNYLIRSQKSEPNVSVLKHLQKPLQILQAEYNFQMPDPICHYSQKLCQLSQKIYPKPQITGQSQIAQTKLMNMQNAQYEFIQIKKNFQKEVYKLKILQDSEENQFKIRTLYNTYFLKVPYYCRFESHNILKNNFANMFFNVAGVNLEAKQAKNIKRYPKINGQKRYNSGALIFDSNFQCGNLLYVYENPSQNDDNYLSYNLILQNDTNTYGHNQWFFFRVQSIKPHLNVKFNIINLTKNESLFSYGLKPLIFSEKQNQKSGIGWLRRGDNIRYFQNDFRRQNKKSFYYTLSFQFRFKETKDWTYFCPSYPYLYTQMTNYIENLYLQSRFKNCFTIKTINQTLGHNKISLITISTGHKPIEDCKIIWILGRQHPSQTTSSYMIQGILKYILNLISEAKNSDNVKLQQLNNYVFKILPMVNVDGVIHGNSRAQLIGLDPNRGWKKPRKTIHPSTWNILKEILSYKSNVSMVLDLHSHSKKTGCFFYGNQLNSSSKLTKIFPTLIAQNDQRFSLKNCRFRGGYKTTARYVLFQQLRIQNIYTVQCSLLGYLKDNRIVEYTIQDYYQMGAKLIQTYLKFQNIKLQKNIYQIISQYSEHTEQLCEVDSAKSDSSISDDEYDQIKELEKKLINKRKKSIGIKSKKNKNITQNSGYAISKVNDNRACSLARQKFQHSSFKIQNRRNLIFSKRQKIGQKVKNRSYTFIKQKKSFTNQPEQIMEQKSKNQIFHDKIEQNRARYSYMKLMAKKKITLDNISFKSKTQQSQKNQNSKDISIQVSKPILNQKQRTILQNSSNKLNIHSFIRPLCVLGNPCLSQFTLYNKNEISIQVCLSQREQQLLLKKQNKLISKLPKLMNLINKNNLLNTNNCNQKVKKLSSSYKENSQYVDSKILVYEKYFKKKL